MTTPNMPDWARLELRAYIEAREEARRKWQEATTRDAEEGLPVEPFEYAYPEYDENWQGAFSDDPDVNRYYETGDEND